MAPKTMETDQQLKLSSGLVGAGDVRRLLRDLEQLEDTLQQMRLKTNAPVAKLPRASRAVEEFAATNRLNLLLPADREQAKAYLNDVIKTAPVIHMSFAAEASRSFTTRLIVWLRTNIAADVLLETGLEPTIAAGCILRTPNKQYDFSLRARFEQQSQLLIAKLQAADQTVVSQPLEPAMAEAPDG